MSLNNSLRDQIFFFIKENPGVCRTEVRDDMGLQNNVSGPAIKELIDKDMVIEGAERFGLAQLHQLRGRIGRGSSKSYCFLFSDSENEVAKHRLEVMTRSNDGFEIAERDLAIRGPGEIFSARQHGLPDFKIANIIEDFDLLKLARKDALKLTEQDAMLTKAEHKNIRTALIERFGETAGLVDADVTAGIVEKVVAAQKDFMKEH